MGVFNKNNINWESFGQDLLWNNIIYHKNEYSGYDIITSINHPEGKRNGFDVGDIGYYDILSFYVGEYKHLTWKELALELGLFEDHLISDGHDCKKCTNHDKCIAFFKDDVDHERCNWWEKNMKPIE